MMQPTMQPKTPTSPLLQTILHWFHSKGGETHCLARLYRQGNTVNDGASTPACAKGIVVLSEIRSNDRHRALMLDLTGAANALIPTFSKWGIDCRSITWLIHHGLFSDYESLQHEEWGQSGFLWSGSQYELDWNKWKSLQPNEVDELHQAIELAPVLDVLNMIGWEQR